MTEAPANPDAVSGATIKSASGCASQLVANVPAGQYKLAVTRTGKIGTYKVAIASG